MTPGTYWQGGFGAYLEKGYGAAAHHDMMMAGDLTRGSKGCVSRLCVRGVRQLWLLLRLPSAQHLDLDCVAHDVPHDGLGPVRPAPPNTKRGAGNARSQQCVCV